jgi:hypothetical protein
MYVFCWFVCVNVCVLEEFVLAVHVFASAGLHVACMNESTFVLSDANN